MEIKELTGMKIEPGMVVVYTPKRKLGMQEAQLSIHGIKRAIRTALVLGHNGLIPVGIIITEPGDKLELLKPKQEEPTASEALFGFCAWLTCRGEQTIMSATDDAAVIADLIKAYCDANHLSEPSSRYPDNLVQPE